MKTHFGLVALLLLPLCLRAQAADPAFESQFAAPVFLTIDFPGAVNTRAYAINDSARIVGSFDRNDSSTHAFFYRNGMIQEMKRPGFFSESYGINNAGEIVGTFTPNFQDGFWFSQDAYHSLNFGLQGTFIAGINNLDDVVGSYWDVCCDLHGYLFHRPAALTTLDYPGAVSTIADDINDAGQIVGSWEDANQVRHGFLLQDGVFTSIDVPGATATFAIGINSAGVIAGSYSDAAGAFHGFLSRDGSFLTVDFPGAQATDLYRVNGLGMFVGDYTDVNGVQHGFVGHR